MKPRFKVQYLHAGYMASLRFTFANIGDARLACRVLLKTSLDTRPVILCLEN